MTKDQIRAIFLGAGFTIKEGQTDLRPYVYDAAYALLSASIADTADVERAEPVAWVYCDTLHAEHCHLSDQDAINDGWLPLVYAWHAGFARDDIRDLAIKCGFKYWRTSDAHGVTSSIAEAEALLADLLGVEVEIGGGRASVAGESIADTAGAKARESLQLTCEQAIRLNAALESPSEPNEALKGAMEKFRAQESRERVSMTYEQFTELASKAKASNDLHMRVLALETSSYLKDEEISHLRKRIAAPPAPSVADAAGARDAERYRWVREQFVMNRTAQQLDELADNMIAKESGND